MRRISERKRDRKEKETLTGGSHKGQLEKHIYTWTVSPHSCTHKDGGASSEQKENIEYHLQLISFRKL